MDRLSETLRVAAHKSELHAAIDDLTERDSVIIVIGKRFPTDDGEAGQVQYLYRNAHYFEARGLMECALDLFRNED